MVTTESMAEGNPLRMAVQECKLADLLPGQPKVLTDATCRWRVNEALAQLTSAVP